MSHGNGQLGAKQLSRIYSGGQHLELANEAAAAYNTMVAWLHHTHGARIEVSQAYRPLGHPDHYPHDPCNNHCQWYFWLLYQHGLGNLAAYPGDSNHGWGLAIDLASLPYRSLIDAYGAQFGWSKSWSDAPSEWWHIVYQPGHWRHRPDPGPNPFYPIARRGSGGKRSGQEWYVLQIQRLLTRHGLRTVKTGKYNLQTYHRVRQFQHQHGLNRTGVVRRHEWELLRSKPKPKHRKYTHDRRKLKS